MRMPWQRPSVPLYWHEEYRPPLSGMEAQGLEPRRAHDALWYLLEKKVVRPSDVREPEALSFETLALVHRPEYLETLLQPETLARIFALSGAEVPVDSLLQSIRLACGGTLAAAREALVRQGPVCNLSGGFHHAAPNHGGGLCALNDVAIAISVLRREGFTRQISILDLDAHPPDGTAACVREDARTWLGSLSGVDWGPLPGAHEHVLPPGADDAVYSKTLDTVLDEMPPSELVFVLAGGDVLRGDALGQLGLSLQGIRERDLRVHRRLHRVSSVWLPSGGYNPAAWRILAGTVLVLKGRAHESIPDSFDPLASHFRHIAGKLTRESVRWEDPLALKDLEADLHMRPLRQPRLLGTFDAQTIEYLMFRYRLLPHIERLGYAALKVHIETTATGDRARLEGNAEGQRHLLIDLIVSRLLVNPDEYLFVQWLSLRHPRAVFGPHRLRLPGQDVPGLGLAREISELLAQMAHALRLQGVMFRPSWFHLAFVASDHFRFRDPERQGRFEALVRDTMGMALPDISEALVQGRVRMNGSPYTWEADDMVYPAREAPRPGSERTLTERNRVLFSVVSSHPEAYGG